jgi:hypothetical protein
LTDLLRRLPSPTRRDGSEHEDEFWKRVGEGLSRVAWDEQGKLIDLQQELPSLVLEAQVDMPSVRAPQEDFWADLKQMEREANRGFPMIYDSKTQRFFPASIRRRDDAAYRRFMARRFVRQFEEEEIDTYGYVAKMAWGMYRKTLSRRNLPYKKFPQPGDVFIVVSSDGSRSLPEDRRGRVALVDAWIANTPEKKYIRGNKGFGGRYAGRRPKRREPGRYLVLKAHAVEVEWALKRDEKSFTSNGEDGIDLIGMKPEKALEYVKATFSQMEAIRGIARKKKDGN